MTGTPPRRQSAPFGRITIAAGRDWDRDYVGSRHSLLTKVKRSARSEDSDETRVIVPETWATRGACSIPPDAPPGLSHAMWAAFDEPTAGLTPAARARRLAVVRTICASCPVLAECREFGMTEEFGFYGGLTAEERAARRRGDDRAHEAIMREVRESERNQRAARGLPPVQEDVLFDVTEERA